jgi:hypothetical protein
MTVVMTNSRRPQLMRVSVGREHTYRVAAADD